MPLTNLTKENITYLATPAIRAKARPNTSQMVSNEGATHNTTANLAVSPSKSVDADLEDPKIFQASLLTLLHSLDQEYDISPNDLNEAYAHLVNTLRRYIKHLTPSRLRKPAFKTLEACSSALSTLLRREIKKLVASSPSVDNDAHAELIQYHAKRQSEETAASHQAMTFIGFLFRHQQLQMLFRNGELEQLFSDALFLTDDREKLTCQKDETCKLVLWMLSTQDLHRNVLIPKKDEIFRVLRLATAGYLGGAEGVVMGLKIVRRFAVQNLPYFQQSMASMYIPFILKQLTSASHDIQREALHAFNGFVLAKFSLQPPPIQHLRSNSSMICKYIAAQTSPESKVVDTPSLLSVLRKIAQNSNPESQWQIWAFVLLTSLIYVADYQLFENRDVLGFFLQSLSTLPLDERSSTILRTLASNALFWSYGQLLLSRNSYTMDRKETEAWQRKKDRCFRVLLELLEKQSGELATPLVAMLRGQQISSHSGYTIEADESQKTMHRILRILEVLAKSSSSNTRLAGLELFRRLLKAENSQDHRGSKPLPSERMFLRKQVTSMERLLRFGNSSCSDIERDVEAITIDYVGPLTVDEMCQHREGILATLINCSLHAIEQGESVLDGFLELWKLVLLRNTEYIHDSTSISEPDAVNSHISTLLTRLLDSSGSQRSALRLASKLWELLRSSVKTSNLTSPATHLLKSLLALKNVSDGDCRSMQADLVIRLIKSIPIGSDNFAFRLEMDDTLSSHVWDLTTKEGEESSAEEKTLFLLHWPFRTDRYDMSTEEMRSWTEALDSRISEFGGPAVDFTEDLCKSLKDFSSRCLWRSLPLLMELIGRVRMTGLAHIPRNLFLVVEKVLQQSHPSKPLCALKMFKFLRQWVLDLSGSEFVISFVSFVTKGSTIWIANNTLPENDYNDHIISFYEDVLSELETIEMSPENLAIITPFLVSAFNRIVPPALGPLAFQAFWTKTYRDVAEYTVHYPSALDAVLRGLRAAEGDVSISSEGTSQIMSCSVVLDSQCRRNSGENTFLFDTGSESMSLGQDSQGHPLLIGPLNQQLARFRDPPKAVGISHSPKSDTMVVQSRINGSCSPAEAVSSGKRSPMANDRGKLKRRRLNYESGRIPESSCGPTQSPVPAARSNDDHSKVKEMPISDGNEFSTSRKALGRKRTASRRADSTQREFKGDYENWEHPLPPEGQDSNSESLVDLFLAPEVKHGSNASNHSDDRPQQTYGPVTRRKARLIEPQRSYTDPALTLGKPVARRQGTQRTCSSNAVDLLRQAFDAMDDSQIQTQIVEDCQDLAHALMGKTSMKLRQRNSRAR